MFQRPKIGFIVEGDSEYHCFPSIVSKVISYNPNYPINNTKGNGRIFNKLDEEIRLMVQYRKPEKIIVTIDLKDLIDVGMIESCIALKERLQAQSNKWLEDHKQSSLADILPSEIIVVIIDKTFETWIMSDLDGLKECKYIDPSKIDEQFLDVDSEVKNPCLWISKKLKDNIDIKNIHHIKHFVSGLDVSRAALKSRSFRKFCKEVFVNSDKYDNPPKFSF